MASSLTIAPALGHALVTAQGQAGGYDAIDDRSFWSVGLQEGAVEAGAYEVTQNSGGANMTVDVACNTGHVVVQGDSVTNQGLYVVRPHTAKATLDIATAHSTNPRVDAVVVQVDDDEHDSGGNTRARVMVISGTATAGATLDNARDGSHGGAAIPSSALHLADVLVPAADTTISNSQIRDRRKWARGAFKVSSQLTGADYTTTSTSFAEIDTTNLKYRVECSGVPLRVSLKIARAGSSSGGGAGTPVLQLWVDGTTVSGTQGFVAAINDSADETGYYFEQTIVPAAGSHLISWAWKALAAGTATIQRGTDYLVEMEIAEIVRQNTANNSTTSG